MEMHNSSLKMMNKNKAKKVFKMNLMSNKKFLTPDAIKKVTFSKFNLKKATMANLHE